MLDVYPLSVRVPLSRGGYALVDAGDYPAVRKQKWWMQDGYAVGHVSGTRHTRVFMHHLVAGRPAPGFQIDHINTIRTDNRRSNLRVVTHQQNMFNQNSVAGTSSKFKGVNWSPLRSAWLAQIGIDGKRIPLGAFDTEKAAALAYDAAAKRFHGEFAKLNCPEDETPEYSCRSTSRKWINWPPDSDVVAMVASVGLRKASESLGVRKQTLISRMHRIRCGLNPGSSSSGSGP